MRVTNNMRQAQVLRDLQAGLAKLADAQQQVATGKRFTWPSEDPVARGRRSQAAEAQGRLDELVAALRTGQRRILDEIKALEQDTPTAYQHPPTGPALLVDRTG